MCGCNACIIGNLCGCQYKNNVAANNTDNEVNEDNEDEYGKDDEIRGDENDENVELVCGVLPDSVIAFWTPLDVKESFYLCVVNEILIADEESFDAYNHYVLEGMQYFSCNYLKIKKEHTKYIQYEKLSQTVFVLPEHLQSPYVEISDDYKLDMKEKQWLEDCA